MSTNDDSTFTGSLLQFRYIRWLYEGSLSLLLAWMFIWVNRTRGFGHTGGLFDRAGQVKIFPYWERSNLLSYLYWHRIINDNGLVLEQVSWSFLLASMIFLILRAPVCVNLMSTILRTVGGALAVFGFPFFYLVDLYSLSHSLLLDTVRITMFPLLVWLELIFVLAGAIVIYLQRRRIATYLTIAFLVLHFSFWGWLTHNYVNPLSLIRTYQMQGYHIWSPGLWISATFYFGFPMFGLFASLLWVLFVKYSSKSAGRVAEPSR
ncbi:MAG TPA: hypothetical protein VN577_05190 [Terriglobales bacterium]|nr:hypothetical protein [Terriglobales bacterium]